MTETKVMTSPNRKDSLKQQKKSVNIKRTCQKCIEIYHTVSKCQVLYWERYLHLI